MNRRMLRLAASLIASGAAALTLQGCPPCGPSSDRIAREWSFERCSDATCGFTAASGSTRLTATFHPGEHGFELAPATTVEASLFESVVPTYSTPEVSLKVRCDPGASLVIELDVMTRASESAVSGSAADEPTRETLRQIVQTSPTWSPTNAWFTAQRRVSRLDTLRLITAGSGRCQVDDLRVFAASHAFCD